MRGCSPILATVLVLLGCAASGAREPGCDRSCLRSLTDRVLEAFLHPDRPDPILAPDVRYTENGREMRPGEGLWRSASALGTHRRYLEDPETQQAVFVGTLEEAGAPALVALRIGVRERSVAEVEAVVARKGSHALFAPERLASPEPLWSEPVDERRSRAQLVAIADSYFEGLERHDSAIIAAARTCRRIENGVQTTQRNGDASAHCAASADRLRYIEGVRNRRFPVVDVERGIVVATVLFDIPGSSGAAPAGESSPVAGLPQDPDDPRVRAALQRPRMLLLTELFKIERGEIQQIEAVMHNLPHGSASGWPD